MLRSHLPTAGGRAVLPQKFAVLWVACLSRAAPFECCTMHYALQDAPERPRYREAVADPAQALMKR